MIQVNTSTEYWQKGASLLHVDPTGTRDLDLPANARAYLIAGVQHNTTAGMTSTLGPCANPRNPASPTPASRAPMVALEEWVTKGIAPPSSRVRSLRNGTAVDTIKMPAIKGLTLAAGPNPIGASIDWIDPPGSGQPYMAASSARRYERAVRLRRHLYLVCQTRDRRDGDPRPSLAERYGSRGAYVAQVKAAADALVAERLLLPAGAEAYVRAAQAADGF